MTRKGTNENNRPRLTRLGIALRDLREERGWSIPELAERSEVDKSIISRLENGITIRPQARNLAKLTCALGVDPKELRELARPRPSRIEEALWSGREMLAREPGEPAQEVKFYAIWRAIGEIERLLLEEQDWKVRRQACLKLQEFLDLLADQSPDAAPRSESDRGARQTHNELLPSDVANEARVVRNR